MVIVYTKSEYFGPRNFPLRVFRVHAHPYTPSHRHNFSELAIVTGGSGLNVTHDHEYPIASGDVFVIRENIVHEIKETENLSMINILYCPKALNMRNWDVRSLPGYHALFQLEPAYRKQHKFESRLHLSVDSLSRTCELINKLDKELSKSTPGFRLISTAVFMEIVVYLSRCYHRSQKETSQSLLRIGKAISYIDENFHKDVLLDELAAIAHMSRRNFQRIFQDAMGQSPIDYLIHQRIKHTVDLLTTTNIPITQIAFTVGFKDSNYLARQFKKVIGCTPREYRKMNSHL